MTPTFKASRHVPGRSPPQGTSPIADAIRERRGARGLTPLDTALLHFPEGAAGWNTLLGAVRTKGSLSADIREIMILRVAAINHASFEWIHHEPVARQAGLTTAQLYIVRDIETPVPPSSGILSPLQTAALVFADASTRNVKITWKVAEDLKMELRAWLTKVGVKEEVLEGRVHDLYVEAAMVIGSYNMVSRFLMSVDVAGMSDEEVPWPLNREEHFVPITLGHESHTIHAITLIQSPNNPWVILSNSLLTNLHMWDYLIPYLLSSSSSFNILIFSQRGHGQSTLPDDSSVTTIPALAEDIVHLLQELEIPTPVHSVIGVSQGGAAALAFSMLRPELTTTIVACDTGPKTPAGNAKAWESRIELIHQGSDGTASDHQKDYLQSIGMKRLAGVTVPRWFPEGSACFPSEPAEDSSTSSSPRESVHLKARGGWISNMVQTTPVNGFIAGARGLSDYDLLGLGLLTHGTVGRVLLVAGSLDGGGKVGEGMKELAASWNKRRGDDTVKFAEIPGAGHLPMVDCTETFWGVVSEFLDV